MNDNNAVVERRKQRAKHVLWFFIMALSEAIGTFLLVFILCTAIPPRITESPPSLVQICMVVMMAVVIIVQVFGPISGSHINPSVTVAAVIFGEISLPAAAVYIVSQLIGSSLGYGAVLIIVPKESLYAEEANMNVTHGFCTTVPSPKVTTIQALLSEYAATSILTLVCCSVWDKRHPLIGDFVSIKFGLTIAAMVGAFAPISGASMNPARTFGPAVFTGIWDRQWIYWLGPLTAALITSLFYRMVFQRNYSSFKPDLAEFPLNRHKGNTGESANL